MSQPCAAAQAPKKPTAPAVPRQQTARGAWVEPARSAKSPSATGDIHKAPSAAVRESASDSPRLEGGATSFVRAVKAGPATLTPKPQAKNAAVNGSIEPARARPPPPSAASPSPAQTTGARPCLSDMIPANGPPKIPTAETAENSAPISKGPALLQTSAQRSGMIARMAP